MLKITRYADIQHRRDEWTQVTRTVMHNAISGWDQGNGKSVVYSYVNINLDTLGTEPLRVETDKLKFASHIYERMCSEHVVIELTMNQRRTMGLGDSPYTKTYFITGRIFS